jgi:cytoskeletal protein CcmA (bactofilin family)
MWEKKDMPPARPAVPDEPPARPAPPTSLVTAPGKIVNIGQSILIQGELSGSEDLTIDGQVKGKISLSDHNLTIGQHGRIQAEVVAKKVSILGQVQGNVVATERVEIHEGGHLEGDIQAPRVAIADGAHFRGKVDMETAPRAAKPAPPMRERPAEAAQGGGSMAAVMGKAGN